uniref:pirin family protein n=1 Tax=Thaumasiovibrio occultus TaxID=1891184 RepID=UPI000B351CC0|nr:pirin family protein [Thaumasiovibrio occultus]
MALRTIQKLLNAHPSADGDGVKIQRVHGFDNPAFSPFLMIDELKSDDASDYVGGFPPHPHRGIETLTYMLKGHFEHKDHMGNVGELRDGGAQWMSAGKGVIHSEMPMMTDGKLHGFQIWINLPATKKMQLAQYHDFQPESITEVDTGNGALLRVISGDITIKGDTYHGPLQKTGVATTVADWQATPEAQLNMCTNPDHQMLLYVYQGHIDVDGVTAQQGQLALLDAGEGVIIRAQDKAGVLILGGEPINEPVVHYGPFVMNSIEEINQAILDYQAGTLTD